MKQMGDITTLLRDLAAHAEPGPWKVTHAGNMHYGVSTDTGRSYDLTIAYARCEWDGFGNGSTRSNAEYIAALSPEVVVGLLDEIERLQGLLADHDRVEA